MEWKESDKREGHWQGGDGSLRIRLGMKEHLALFVALLETIAIPLLVTMAVLAIIVFLPVR